jgi:hypothetical protein
MGRVRRPLRGRRLGRNKQQMQHELDPASCICCLFRPRRAVGANSTRTDTESLLRSYPPVPFVFVFTP